MEIYRLTDHRKILTGLLARKRQGKTKLTFSALAERIGVQKTYVSRIMAGTACWSGDQAFLISEELGLEVDEAKYFSLLVEFERSGLEKRKSRLRAEIKELRRRNLRARHTLQETKMLPEQGLPERYLADPYHSIAHVYLTIGKHQRHMSRLAQLIGVSLPHLQSILEVLEGMGVLRYDRVKDLIQMKEQRIHTPTGSSLVQANQLLYRAMALDRIHRCPADRKNLFNAVFAGDISQQETIWAEFLKFISRVQKLNNDSPPHEVFYMQFDLFPWSGQEIL